MVRFFIKILSGELQLYHLIIPQQPICNNGLIQCNYNPNIWNTFDYWNEIFCKSKDPSRPWVQMNWTSQKKIWTIENCVKNYERSFHFAAYFRTIKVPSIVLGSNEKKCKLMHVEHSNAMGGFDKTSDLISQQGFVIVYCLSKTI